MYSNTNCCFFFCASDNILRAESIAMSTLEGLEKTLQEEFFTKHYKPLLLDFDEPKPGFVEKVIFKQQLMAGILRGFKQYNMSATSITDQEVMVISTQLIHAIFIIMLTEQTQFNYDQNLINPSYSDPVLFLLRFTSIPNYGQLYPSEVENFLETVRSLPNGHQIDLKTENPLECKALDLQVFKAISTALKNLDIAEATVTSINTYRSQMLENKTGDMQQLVEMFDNNSSDTTSRI